MKKTRNLLFICAVFTAIALLFTATAMAAEDYELAVENDIVTFTHSVKLINANGGSYYGPDVTFTYEITPLSESEVSELTISDGSSSANVKAGPAGSVKFTESNATTDSVTYSISDGPKPYSEVGTAFTKNISLTFEMDQFSAPGIYRYKLEDKTDASTLYEAGIVRPVDYDKELYLDVYVVNGDNGLTVSAARLVPANTSITSNDGKPGGFEGDEYYTFDFKLTKEVAGSMGDKTHPFPFTITVDNKGLPYFIEDTSEGAEAGSTVSSTETTISVALKNGESFKIYGLCDKATVTVTETNDTSDTYTVTITGKNDTAFNSGDVATNRTITATITSNQGSTTDLPISTYDSENTTTNVSNEPDAAGASDITFENKLDSVSPTGLVLRYGPFVLLLAGAVCFFAVGRKRKETKEESDSI